MALGETMDGDPPAEDMDDKDLLPAEEVAWQEGDPKVLEEWKRLEVES